MTNGNRMRADERWAGWMSFREDPGSIVGTLPETNIAPTNGWLEYYFPIGEAYFQGRTVSFREGRISSPIYSK